MTVTVTATVAFVCDYAETAIWALSPQGDRDRSRSPSHVGAPDRDRTGGCDRPLCLEVDLNCRSAVQPGGLGHAVRVQRDFRLTM